MFRALIVPVVAAVIVEAVTTAPVVPLTVKLEVSTAIPPSKLTRVEVVAPLPVTEERVEVLEIVTSPVAPETEISVPATLEVTPALAMVTVPDPLPVVVIPVPAAMVAVPPWEMVEFDPEVEASVNKEPP